MLCCHVGVTRVKELDMREKTSDEFWDTDLPKPKGDLDQPPTFWVLGVVDIDEIVKPPSLLKRLRVWLAERLLCWRKG